MNQKLKTITTITAIVFLTFLTLFVLTLSLSQIKKLGFVGIENRTRTIQVLGEGKVYVSPDTAKIVFSVMSEKKTTELALNDNNERMQKVIDYLKENGLEDKEIKTIGFSIVPIYDYDYYGLRKRTLSSYQVYNRIEVKIKDLDKVSTLIDGAVRAGANEVYSLEFLVSNEKEYQKQAREMAIKEANQKALETSRALGTKLGRIINFSEDTGFYYPVAREAIMDLGMGGAGEVPIARGENEIIINVRIEYEIR